MTSSGGESTYVTYEIQAAMYPVYLRDYSLPLFICFPKVSYYCAKLIGIRNASMKIYHSNADRPQLRRSSDLDS